MPANHDGRGRRLPRLVLAAFVIAAVVVVLYHPRKHGATAQPVFISSVGHPILGIRAGWELFGLTTSNSVVSVQFDRGRLTLTALPRTERDVPVSFIVGPQDVIVRPLHNVSGYMIPDGLPPRPLTGILGHASVLLPGPNPGTEWVIGSGITLVGPAGTATGIRLAALTKQYPAQSATSDGRGNLVLFNSSGSQFDAGPHGVRPVGALLVAVGPTDWLGLSCHDGNCRNVVIDGATAAHRFLPGPGLDVVDWPWPADPGVAAPDGSLAAVTVAGSRQEVALDLISLSTGAVRTVPVAVNLSSSSRTLAWSPDSQWLFVITATGGLVAVSAHNGTVHSVGVALPRLSQIAMRGADG